MRFLFKILIAGDGGVGKTSLLRRYVDGMFDETTIETVGVDFFIKEVQLNNVNCTLQLWDLGGQKRFRHLIENYVMGARGALLLFDMTRMPDINNILEWVNIVRVHDFNLPIVLVGTKLDLEDVIAVDKESVLHIKNTFNMVDYIKTSAKTGFSVEEPFKILANILKEKSKY